MAETEWTHRRILIVDSDIEFMSWADRVLRTAGAEVRCTLIVDDAPNILKEFTADAIILDLDSGPDAVALVEGIRAGGNGVPVVVKAAAGDIAKIRAACSAGIENLLRKPVEKETFLKRISATLADPRRLIVATAYFGSDRRRTQRPIEGPDRRRPAPVPASTPTPATRVRAREEPPPPITEEGRREIMASPDSDDRIEKRPDLNLFNVLDDHQVWLRSEGREGKQANLAGIDLRGATLHRANLTRAHLRRVNLSEAEAHRAIFEGADLGKADLSRGDFRNANFSLAKLRFAVMAGANLEGARFRSADLSAADLRGANLRLTDLAGAQLMGADLRGADVRNSMGLTQDQLNRASADATTRLPKGLRPPAAQG